MYQTSKLCLWENECISQNVKLWLKENLGKWRQTHCPLSCSYHSWTEWPLFGESHEVFDSEKKSKYEQNVRFDDASNQIRAALNASPFWVLPQIWTLRIKVCFSVSLRVERWRKNRQSVGNQPPNDCLWSFGGNRLTNGSPCVLCHFLLMWSASDDQWSGCV